MLCSNNNNKDLTNQFALQVNWFASPFRVQRPCEMKLTRLFLNQFNQRRHFLPVMFQIYNRFAPDATSPAYKAADTNSVIYIYMSCIKLPPAASSYITSPMRQTTTLHLNSNAREEASVAYVEHICITSLYVTMLICCLCWINKQKKERKAKHSKVTGTNNSHMGTAV